MLSLVLTLVLALGMLPASALAANSGSMGLLLSAVEPKTLTGALPGEEITLRALADADAAVTASFGGQSFTLKKTAKSENGFYWFEYDYTVSGLVQDGQSLGEITFTAQKGSRTEQKIVPGIVIAKLEGIVLPDPPGDDVSGLTPASGQQIQITAQANKNAGLQHTTTAKYAEVYIPVEKDRGEEYSAPYYYNLPVGTIDYIEEVSGNYYILKSGRKIKAGDAKIIAQSGSQGQNKIETARVSTGDGFTTLSLGMDWNVPFNVEVSPISYSGSTNTVNSCTPVQVILTFDYTTDFVPSRLTLPSGGAFSGVSWTTKVNNGIAQLVMTFTLSQKGGYYGCYAEYGRSGQLELKFRNPITSIEDAVIVIDPGHGDNAGNKDPGTTIGNIWESELNWEKACALRDELEARGATVYLLDTKHENFRDLYDRVNTAITYQPHLYLSVHHNSADNKSARGVEVYYNTPFSKNLAKNISNNIYWAYQKMEYGSTAVNRGDKWKEFAVNRFKQFASVLIEYGFLTNAEEFAVCTNQSNLSLFASATADGVEAYLAGE